MKNKARGIFIVLFLMATLFFLASCERTFALSLDEGITANVENPLKIKKGTLVTVTVTLPEGKEIDELLINGVAVVLEGNKYSFNITRKTKVTATFKDKETFYSLELQEGITADVGDLSKIPKNTKVTLSFSIDGNKEIDKLLINNEQITLTGASYSFFINENTTVELVLKDKEVFYSLTLGTGITASVSPLNKILKGTEVVLSFSVPEDKEIDKVLVNGTIVTLVNEKYTFNITEDTTVELVLKDKEVFYSLTLGTGITTTISPLNKILKGTEVVLSFSVPEDKEIDKVLVNGTKVTLVNEKYTFNITEDTTVELVLKDKEVFYSLTLGAGITASVSPLNKILKGTEVVLSFSVPEDKEIDKVLVNGTKVTLTNEKYTFNITEDTTVELVLKDKEVFYSLTLGAGITASVSPLNKILKGTEVVLSFSVPEDKEIDKVLVNGTKVTLVNEKYTFNITEDITAELVLKDKPFTLTLPEDVSSNASDPNSVIFGTNVLFTITVPIGKTLKEVKVNDVVVTTTENTFSVVVVSDIVVLVEYNDIYLSLDLPVGVTANLTDLAEIKYNTLVTLTVNVAEGYGVSEFLVNNELKELTNNTYTFNIVEDTEVLVSFVKLTYKLTLGEDLIINIDDLDNIDYETLVIVTIEVPVNKEFKALMVNGEEVVVVDNTYEFVIKEDTIVNVLFKEVYSLTLPEHVSSNLSDLDNIYEGTKVILTVTIPANQIVSLFKVNEEGVSLVNNTYEFFINSNTVVEVEFKTTYKLILPEHYVTADVVDLNIIAEGTIITLTVALEDNQELDYFKVNSVNVSLVDNKYQFSINQDTIVSISYSNYYSLTLQEGLTVNVENPLRIKEGTEVILTLNLPKEKHLKTLYVNNDEVNNFSNYYKFKVNEDSDVTFTYYDEALLFDILNFLVNVDKTLIREGVFKFSQIEYETNRHSIQETIFDFDSDLNINRGANKYSFIYNDEERFYNSFYEDYLFYSETYGIIDDVVRDFDYYFDINVYQSHVFEMMMAAEMFGEYLFVPTGPYSINDFVYQLIEQYLLMLKADIQTNAPDNIHFYKEEDNIIVVYNVKASEIYSIATMIDYFGEEELDAIIDGEFFLQVEFLFTNNEFVNLKAYFTHDIELLNNYLEFKIGYFNDEIIFPEKFYDGDINDFNPETYYFHYDEETIVTILIPEGESIEVDALEYLTPYKKGYVVEGYYSDSSFTKLLIDEDLVNGANVYIKWEEIKPFNELINNFIYDGLFIISSDGFYPRYLESEKYIFYGLEEGIIIYDKLNKNYYKYTIFEDEMFLFSVEEGSYNLVSIMDYLTDETYFKIETKGAYFDLNLLVGVSEDNIFISSESPFNILPGIYQHQEIIGKEEFNGTIDGLIANVVVDEMYDLDFYYEHHYYDINNLEDDLLFYMLFKSGTKKVASLKELKEDYNVLDYELPSDDNDYTLILIIDDREIPITNFIYFDGNRGKIIVYEETYYYLDEIEELPLVTVGEFETLINYKVDKFYFKTLEELRDYETTSKVLILEPGKVDIIKFADLLDVFSSYQYLVIEHHDFFAYYNFESNSFSVLSYFGFNMYLEFNESEVIVITDDFSVIISNSEFNKDSFMATFLPNWGHRFIFDHLYTIYYQLNNVTPRKENNTYEFNDFYLDIYTDYLEFTTDDNFWVNSVVEFSNQDIDIEIDENYNYELIIDSNIFDPIYYYTNEIYFNFNYYLNDYYFIDLYNYDQNMNVDYDSLFYPEQFFSSDSIRVYALYGKFEEVSYYLDYYKSFDKYILEDSYRRLRIKVDVNSGIEFYYFNYEGEYIIGYIDLATGDKYRVLDDKLYLTDDPLLFNIVEFFNEVEPDDFEAVSDFRYSYYDIDWSVNIYVKYNILEIYFYENDTRYTFNFIDQDFENYDFTNYETDEEKIVGLELLNFGLSSVHRYEDRVRFQVSYNTGSNRTLSLFELKEIYDVEVNIEKYQTTIIIDLEGDVYTFILDNENSFIFNTNYGLLYIFEDTELIYEDDLISQGTLPVGSYSTELFEFSGWKFEEENIDDLTHLLNLTEQYYYYEYVYLEQTYTFVSYDNLVEVFKGYEYIVLSNYEYTAFYNFNESRFYIYSSAGLFYIAFNDEDIIFESEEAKYIIPHDKFNYDSFINQFNYWYYRALFENIYAIYYELNNINPNKYEYVYEFDRVSLFLHEYDQLGLWVANGFHVESELSFTNEEIEFEINYEYDFELTIDNDFTRSIHYYASHWYHYYNWPNFDYTFEGYLLEAYFHYDENMDVDYNNEFYFENLEQYVPLQVYALYTEIEDAGYYLDYYNSFEKYILEDWNNGLRVKIDVNSGIEFYEFNYEEEDIIGYIDLATGDKYIINDNKLFLSEAQFLFNFVEFFNETDQEDFYLRNNVEYFYHGNSYDFSIDIIDYGLRVDFYGYWTFRFQLIEQGFDNFDFSSYEVAVEEAINFELLEDGIRSVEDFYYTLEFIVQYNSGVTKYLYLYQLIENFDVDINIEKYQTTITIDLDGEEFIFVLDDLNNFIYNSNYGILYIFYGAELIYEDDLNNRGTLPSYEFSEQFYEFSGWRLDHFEFSDLEELLYIVNRYFYGNNYIYLFPEYSLISYDDLTDLFKSYEYIVLSNNIYTAYYNFKDNYIYLEGRFGVIYLEFNDEYLIFKTDEVKYMIPQEGFNYQSFISQIADYDFMMLFRNIYNIYYDLNYITPHLDGQDYYFDNLYIYANNDQLYLHSNPVIGADSVLEFSNEEVGLQVNFEYDYEVIIDNDFTSSIHYYVTDSYHYNFYKYFDYSFENVYFDRYYHYDENLNVNYEDEFDMDDLEQYNQLRIYGAYYEIFAAEHYLDYYQSLEKYILTDIYSGSVYKIKADEAIDIYFDDEIFGYIDLLTGEKYLVIEDKLYLNDYFLLFNFVEFFFNTPADYFERYSYYYFYETEDIYFEFDIRDYVIEIYHYNFWDSQKLELTVEDFESFDFSSYEIEEEKIIDLQMFDNSLLPLEEYQYIMEFGVFYNTGFVDVLTLYELMENFDVDINIEKYQTTITIDIDGEEFIFVLDDLNNFIYNSNYGILFIFEDVELIYEDDLIRRGTLPVSDVTIGMYEFSRWLLDRFIVWDFEYLFDLIEDYFYGYDYVYLEPDFSFMNYTNFIEMLKSYEYIVISKEEYTAYYNFNENYFYLDSNEGLMYIEFNNEYIIFETEEVKYMIPQERFDVNSFVDQIFDWYYWCSFVDIYMIYYELNYGAPVIGDDYYGFDNLEIYMEDEELRLFVYNGFYTSSLLEFSNDEVEYELNYEYDYEVTINNDITSNIYYYVNHIYHYGYWQYFEYSAELSYFVGFYHYDENLNVDYENQFDMDNLDQYDKLTIYGAYEEVLEVEHYLDYYQSLDKYILTDYFSDFVYKINSGKSIDIYLGDDIFGYINLETNEKYIVSENTLYLSDYFILFNFVEFFFNVSASEFINYENSYDFKDEDFFFSFDVRDYTIYLYNDFYNREQLLLLSEEDFESFDYSGYEYDVEKVVDVEVKNRSQVIQYYFSYYLALELTYNSGIKIEFSYEQWSHIIPLDVEFLKYETIVTVFVDETEFVLFLSDYDVFVYNSYYGLLFSFDNKIFLYKEDLYELGELPVVESNEFYYEFKHYTYYEDIVTFDDFISLGGVHGVYYIEANYQLKEIDNLIDSFTDSNYLFLYNSDFTAYYNYSLNYFYVTSYWATFYVSFGEDEFVYQNENMMIVIPIDEFNFDSFKEEVLGQKRAQDIFEYIYIVYDSFNNQTAERNGDEINFPNMTIGVQYSNLYFYIENDWYSYAFISLCDENLLLENFPGLIYDYELIINNEITSSIHYYSNSKNIDFSYEFANYSLVNLYNYDSEMAVDYNSVFDPDQFDSDSVIEVFALYV